MVERFKHVGALNLEHVGVQSICNITSTDLAHGGRRRAVRHHHVGAPDGGQARGGQVAAGHRRAWEQETIAIRASNEGDTALIISETHPDCQARSPSPR